MAETRARRNPNNVDELKGVEVAAGAVPGRPSKEVIADNKKVISKEIKEVMYRTPKGIMCKNVFEIIRTKRGTFKKLLRTEKNAKF